MFRLPEKTVNFLFWWLVGAPKRIFITSQRAVALLNNELSFTLNIKLLFTPLFGDYTIPGRLIGFSFRITEVIVGSVVVLALWLLTFVLPIFWWALPFWIAYQYKILVIPFMAGLFFASLSYNKDTPKKRVEAGLSNLKDAYRPISLSHLEAIGRKGQKAIDKLIHTQEVQLILKRTELLNEDFISTLSNTSTDKPEELVKRAFEYALEQKTRYVEPEQVFLAYLDLLPNRDRLLSTYSSEIQVIEQTVKWILTEKEELSRVFFWQEDYKMPLMGGIGKGMTGRVTPLLDSFSEDLTRKALKGWVKKVVGREKEIREVAELLNGTAKNVMIIGDPGSGKTAIVRGVAFKIVEGVEYENLKFKRLVNVNTSALIAGTKSMGDLSEKINRVIKEVEGSGDIILFFDEIHTLVNALSGDQSESFSIFSLLEPHLAKRDLQFIGATTRENYRKFIEPNGAFSRLFEKVEITESSPEDTLEILKQASKDIERQYKCLITYPAFLRVTELSQKLIHERVLPDKALDILYRTASKVTYTTKYVTSEEIAMEISDVTHIPVSAVTQNEADKLLNIEQEMRNSVIGQNDAINQISSALKRARVGIRNENKPIASFLFVGTTGIGKTETAKTLARVYFGEEKAMIRLDMSEYQNKDSIDRLIGTSDGKTKGILTEAIRTRPFSLLLLDEIEKADSGILLTFLQVLDDGRLTDTTGRVIDFTNTIIIATSNAGTTEIQKISEDGGSFKDMRESAEREVRKRFAPEFLNRFNGIIVFRPLNMSSVQKITEIILKRVSAMAENKGIKVSFKPELVEELTKRGYDPQWGARPLTRVIENAVETYIATKMLEKNIQKGDSIDLGVEILSEEYNEEE